MYFSLDVRRARKGDCLLLHYGSSKNPGLVMIDGGPKAVYSPHLRPRLEEIRKKRAKGNNPLQVDLLMVSHVDDDHIQGILDLTRELRRAADEQKPQLVQILGLWHNSFDNIISHNTKELTAAVTGQFGAAAVNGSAEFSDEDIIDVEEHYKESDPNLDSEEAEELVSSSLKVLASIGQGAQLRLDAEKLRLPLNEDFDDGLIVAKGGAKPIDLGNDLTFTVVGPMLPEIDALRKKHLQWLKKLKKEGKKPSEVLAAYVDRSVPNLSSLVLLAELKGKRMLLTGDARGDKILEGLEMIGLVKKCGKIEVDLLKVPHHGSSNNLDHDFFERIIAKHYVFSGDGEHGNPEREAMEMLFEARGHDDYTIHLTYPIDEIDEGRQEDWNRERNKEKMRKTKNPKQKMRPNWSKPRNSLRAFFDAHEGLEDKVEVVDEKKPHVIDLLDRVTS
jgi:hypothetical protein